MQAIVWRRIEDYLAETAVSQTGAYAGGKGFECQVGDDDGGQLHAITVIEDEEQDLLCPACPFLSAEIVENENRRFPGGAEAGAVLVNAVTIAAEGFTQALQEVGDSEKESGDGFLIRQVIGDSRRQVRLSVSIWAAKDKPTLGVFGKEQGSVEGLRRFPGAPLQGEVVELLTLSSSVEGRVALETGDCPFSDDTTGGTWDEFVLSWRTIGVGLDEPAYVAAPVTPGFTVWGQSRRRRCRELPRC